MLRVLFTALAVLLASADALAQSPVSLCQTITPGGRCVPINSGFPLSVMLTGGSFVNITTNTDTNVKSSPGALIGFTVNTAGTTSNIKLYNDADGTCSSGLIGTFATTGVVAFVSVPVNASIGICAKTAGGAAADVTVYFK